MSKDLVSYDEQLAKAAAQYATAEQGASSQFITTRAGVLRVGDTELPGNQMAVVILDAIRENTYYGKRFDPDSMSPPVCYAFGYSDAEMAPHASMQADPEWFKPQFEQCMGCPMAEWGTADTGRGKACQNRRRLAVLPAGYYSKKPGSRDFDLELFDDPKHFETADIAFLKLPITSVKGWGDYAQSLSKTLHLPPYGVITRVYTEPDPKTQYKIRFQLIEKAPPHLIPTLIARHGDAQRSIAVGYRPPQEGGNRLAGRR